VLAVPEPERVEGAAAAVREGPDAVGPAHLAVDEERDAVHGPGDLQPPRHATGDHLLVRESARVDLEPHVLVHDEPLRIGEALDEPHEEPPVPVLAGIGVVVDAAALERVVRVGHLAVADDVPAVDRDHGAARDYRGDARRSPVLRQREPR
jgi:hypothetical protein